MLPVMDEEPVRSKLDCPDAVNVSAVPLIVTGLPEVVPWSWSNELLEVNVPEFASAPPASFAFVPAVSDADASIWRVCTPVVGPAPRTRPLVCSLPSAAVISTVYVPAVVMHATSADPGTAPVDQSPAV